MPDHRSPLRFLVLLLFLTLPLSPDLVRAQSADDEPLLESLRRAFKQEALSLGLIVRTLGSVQFDAPENGGNGFSIPSARFSVRGRLDHGFHYVLQTEFARSPAVLDARLSYDLSERLTLHAGMFKAPFSAEFLIPLPAIDFVSRAQVVNVLAPNRQVGLMLEGRHGDLSAQVGVFNGNGRVVAGNDDNRLLYVGRLQMNRALPTGRLEIGANVAYDDPAEDGTDVQRLRLGGDARLEQGRWMIAGEAIYADLDPEAGPARSPFGYHVTVGYDPIPGRHQLLLRWDAFDRDVPGDDARTFLVAGYNFDPTSTFSVQVNYLIPTEDADPGNHRLLVELQLAL